MKKILVSLVLGMSLFTFAYWFNLFDLFDYNFDKLNNLWGIINSSIEQDQEYTQQDTSGTKNDINNNETKNNNSINSFSMSMINNKLEIRIVSTDKTKINQIDKKLESYCKNNNLSLNKSQVEWWYLYKINWEDLSDNIDDLNGIVFWNTNTFDFDITWDNEEDPFDGMKGFEDQIEQEFEKNDFSIPLPIPQKSETTPKAIKI